MFVAILFGFKYKYTLSRTTHFMKVCILMYIKLASLLNLLVLQTLKESLGNDKAVCVKVLC